MNSDKIINNQIKLLYFINHNLSLQIIIIADLFFIYFMNNYRKRAAAMTPPSLLSPTVILNFKEIYLETKS